MATAQQAKSRVQNLFCELEFRALCPLEKLIILGMANMTDIIPMAIVDQNTTLNAKLFRIRNLFNFKDPVSTVM